MSDYKRNYNNNNNDTPVAWMVAHEDKNGDTYWKGYADLGGGKGVRLMMFENTKDGTKSDFRVSVYKKKYDVKKRNNRDW